MFASLLNFILKTCTIKFDFPTPNNNNINIYYIPCIICIIIKYSVGIPLHISLKALCTRTIFYYYYKTTHSVQSKWWLRISSSNTAKNIYHSTDEKYVILCNNLKTVPEHCVKQTGRIYFRRFRIHIEINALGLGWHAASNRFTDLINK